MNPPTSTYPAALPAAVAVVHAFWQLMEGNDFHAVGVLLSDDYVLDWPQSNERIRGRERFGRLNAEYPAHGRWRFTVHRVVGNDEEAVSDVSVTDGVQHARALSFFRVAGGRIVHQVEYWPEPYQAPANRRHLVEPIDAEASESAESRG